LSDAVAALKEEMRRREATQSALLQAQKLEALGHLTGGVAHDFNNVLAAVLGSLELIGRRAEDPDRVRELAARASRAADRAAALVRQLLAFARQEPPVPEPFDPASLLGGVDDLIRRAVGSGVEVKLHVPEGSWPVMVDAHRLEVALLNLAVNARDAMRGSGTLTVRVRNEAAAERPGRDASADRDHVVIEVQDDGPGMPTEVLAHATDAFFTTKERGHGTGLGLSMVKQFVEQSGGTLSLANAPEGGLRVEMRMPRSALPGRPRQVARRAPDPSLHGNAVILVVDDDDQVRAVTVAMLCDLGYEVVEASSLMTADAVASGLERLDMLLTDLTMVGGSGLQLADRLRGQRPGLPVVFMTGLSVPTSLDGESLLAKPFSPDLLAESVLVALGRLPKPSGRLSAAIERRVRDERARRLFVRWRVLAEQIGVAGWSPDARRIDIGDLLDVTFLAEVDMSGEKPRLRFARMGEELRRGLAATGVDPDEPSEGMVRLYAQAVSFGVPSHDFSRVRSGGGGRCSIERLVLPVSVGAEGPPTHVLGCVVIEVKP
jgi:nitrogen-specific signal transduction histidine kinase/CheY-like chemotaxis protein